MPDNWPAIWSAIAATCSAISSALIWSVQRRNFFESVRPELVLLGWSRTAVGEGESAHEVIGFKIIKNVGRGVALDIPLNAHHEVNNRPTAVLGTTLLSILAPNEQHEVNGDISVWWKNVEPDAHGGKVLPIRIVIYCWDSRGIRHETQYNLIASEFSQTVGISMGSIAPGVMLGQRKTIITGVWVLRLRLRLNTLAVKTRAKLQRLPLLGGFKRRVK
jgi:hypothetical protein